MTDLPRIGKPAGRALAGAGVTSIEQVATYSVKQLLALHGLGPKVIDLLKPALAEQGLSFAPDQG